MAQERPEEVEEDQQPPARPLVVDEAGHGRRTFGLGLFFLASSIGALVVWWLALYSPVSLDNLFRHYEGIESATKNVGFGFIVIAAICFALSAILLLVAFVEGRRSRPDSSPGG
jgi:hypothetical protein